MSPWTVACALYALGQHGDPSAVEVCERAARTQTGIVSETARMAVDRLRGDPARATEGMIPMQTTFEKMFFLRSVPLFDAVPEDLMMDIAHATKVVEIAGGACVYAQGDFGDSLFVIGRGKVALQAGGQNVAELGEREVFGELSALDPTLRSTTALALEDVTLYKVEHKELDDVISADVTVTRNIIRILARRLRAANEAGFAKVAMATRAIEN
jgi:hypothetical protein